MILGKGSARFVLIAVSFLDPFGGNMSNKNSKISFSNLFELCFSNIEPLSSEPCLYMICKKDISGNNQVIFAGVASNLKLDLARQIENKTISEKLYFCYSPTSAKNVLKNSKNPLYERVA